jgi:hypothetical protein
MDTIVFRLDHINLLVLEISDVLIADQTTALAEGVYQKIYVLKFIAYQIRETQEQQD